MSDPNERSEATQQGERPARDNTEGKVEATPAAERKAQELGVDPTNVEGTGSGGRVTASDPKDTYRQTDTTARSAEATQPLPQVGFRAGDPCNQAACRPSATALQQGGCSGPDGEAILEQYAVLKATLASPIPGVQGPFDLSQDIVVKVVADGTPFKTVKVVETDASGAIKIHFPGAKINFSSQTDNSGPPFACNFFAPMPPSAPVKWPLPHPQPLLPSSSLNACQGCLVEPCDPCSRFRPAPTG